MDRRGYGAPGWLSGLKPLPSAHDPRVLGSSPTSGCLLGRELASLPLSLPASLPTCDLGMSNKYIKSLKKTSSQVLTDPELCLLVDLPKTDKHDLVYTFILFIYLKILSIRERERA